MKKPASNKTSLHFSQSSFIDAFFVNLTGFLQICIEKMRYLLVFVEHLTICSIFKIIETSTSNEVKTFIEKEMIHLFGAPRTAVSDNAMCFSAPVLC